MTSVRGAVFEDLVAVPDDGSLHEFVRGEIRQMPPPKGEHGGVEMAVAGAIERYLYGWAVALGWQESDGRAARQRLVGYLGGGGRASGSACLTTLIRCAAWTCCT